MVHLTIDLKGKDAVFLSNTYRYHSGLCTLDIYRNAPEQLATDLVLARIDELQQAYEGGSTGNRSQIALRKALRKQVTELFKKVRLYLQLIATEEDIPALIQAGFGVRRFVPRKKVVVLPAT